MLETVFVNVQCAPNPAIDRWTPAIRIISADPRRHHRYLDPDGWSDPRRHDVMLRC